MKIMVVGSGGREHAIIKKLKQSDGVDKIYALPGNGGISADALCVNIRATDIESIVRFAEETGIDYAVVWCSVASMLLKLPAFLVSARVQMRL